MTTRTQILRSSTPGQAPAAGTRLPGEMWTTFPDLQLGVIDTSRNAQKLIAVRFFSTTANYAVGDLVSRAGSIYSALVAITAGAFNPAQWSKLLVAADLPPGNVPAMNDNRIINGDMRIDQRNNGASGTANAAGTFVVDRWNYFGSQVSKVTWGRNLNALLGPAGFPWNVGFQSSSAYAVVAADTFNLGQAIEADMISDFAWGTTDAQPVTLSFFVYSSLTGTFSGSVANYAGTRSYPFTFSIPTANTWTKIVVAIPGDTGGTWVLSNTGGSVYLRFDLGSGATYRGPANAWASTLYIGVTGSVSVVGTNVATFYVTGVKLEIGSVATSYNRQSLAKSMADCQRYYINYLPAWFAGYAAAGAGVGQSIAFPVAMRAAPSIVFSPPTYTNCSGITLQAPGVGGIAFNITVTATGSFVCASSIVASAEL